MPTDDRPVAKKKTVKPRQPLQTDFRTTATALIRYTSRVQRLMDDDRWAYNREQLATGWDADIERMQQILHRLRTEFAQARATPDPAAPGSPDSEGEVHAH